MSPDRRALPLSFGALAAWFVFAYYAGSGSYLRINDNLDGTVPEYRLVAAQPLFAPLDARVEPLMGGVPLSSLRTGLNLGAGAFFVLEPLWAQALTELVVRLVAFAGLYRLLRRRWLAEEPPWLVCGASLAFALLPFLPAGHLSVAGQPWLLDALLRVREGRARASDWAYLAVFPFASSLAYIGPYVVLVAGGVAAFELARTRRIPWRPGAALLLLGGGYAVSEYRLLFQTFLDPGYVSFRAEWDHRRASLPTALLNAVRIFLFSQHHAAAAQFPFVHVSVLLALGLAGLVARRRGTLSAFLREPLRADGWREPSRPFAIVLCVALAGLLALGAGLYNWGWTQDALRATGIPVLNLFGLHRFQWFHPLLFSLAFAGSLAELARQGERGRVLACGLLAVQLGWVVYSSDPLRERRESGLTYAEFYSPALFDEIRDYIGRPTSDYRVASFALAPGIAAYNGFRTVDGFLSNYPLEYKHRFRAVIAPELERDPLLRDVFDKWGSHVHLYSSELGMIVGYRKRAYWTKDQPVRKVVDLRFDAEALSRLGAEYVLSAVEIEGCDARGLRFERRFERADSPWQIFLYAVRRETRPDRAAR
jgi:hypothetical protein